MWCTDGYHFYCMPQSPNLSYTTMLSYVISTQIHLHHTSQLIHLPRQYLMVWPCQGLCLCQKQVTVHKCCKFRVDIYTTGECTAKMNWLYNSIIIDLTMTCNHRWIKMSITACIPTRLIPKAFPYKSLVTRKMNRPFQGNTNFLGESMMEVLTASTNPLRTSTGRSI